MTYQKVCYILLVYTRNIPLRPPEVILSKRKADLISQSPDFKIETEFRSLINPNYVLSKRYELVVSHLMYV